MNPIYHVFNRSIAKYKIFNNAQEYSRMLDVMSFYQLKNRDGKFSQFFRSPKSKGGTERMKKNGRDYHRVRRINIIAYCLMPTHFHLIVEELRTATCSKFLSDILNSYTRFFNLRHNRMGPLWQGRTKKVLVQTDEQLLHLTRYIHLNPVTAYLVDYPEEWKFSSYGEYVSEAREDKICQFDHVLDINPGEYKKFVEDRVAYQRELSRIKDLIFE